MQTTDFTTALRGRAENLKNTDMETMTPPTITLEDVQRIEEYTKRATAGPQVGCYDLSYVFNRNGDVIAHFNSADPVADAANSHFFTNIRTDAERLCAGFREVVAENERLKAALTEIAKQHVRHDEVTRLAVLHYCIETAQKALKETK